MRNTIEDPEKLADKLDEDDLDIIKEALEEAREWLDSNHDADKEDFDD